MLINFGRWPTKTGNPAHFLPAAKEAVVCISSVTQYA